jgi:hypothetical protein
MSLLNRSIACRDFQRARLSRRTLISAGGLGYFGLSLPQWMRLREARAAGKSASVGGGSAKHVILLYQFGGPSHIDTFDPKPDAPAEIRGEFKTIATPVPGLRLGEHLPRTARLADKFALVRSLHHNMKNHNTATYYQLTGHVPPIDDIRLRDSPELYPAYGSVVSRFVPPREGLPSFVALPYVMSDGVVSPGQHASFLGRAYDPLLIKQDPSAPDFRLPELSLPADTPLERIEDRRKLLELVDRQAGLLDWCATARGIDTYHRRAFAMLASPAVKKAFDIASEPAKVRDAYGRTAYGQSCLLARRLVQAGVTFVNVYFSSSIGGAGSGGWDTHQTNFIELKSRLLPATEQTLPTLIEDLDSHGLLKETLVVWTGDFGRAPKLGDRTPDGRGHWPQCFTALLAGGGVRGGAVYGSSDKSGAFPKDNPVLPDDVAATVFNALGVSPGSEMHDIFRRPLVIAGGKPLTALFG